MLPARYLEKNTTIAVPHVHAFGTAGPADENNPTGHAYIILDCVPGNSVDIKAFVHSSRERKSHFYSQLADILA